MVEILRKKDGRCDVVMFHPSGNIRSAYRCHEPATHKTMSGNFCDGHWELHEQGIREGKVVEIGQKRERRNSEGG